MQNQNDYKGNFPPWLHKKLPKGHELFKTRAILKKKNVFSVCENANCQNRYECYSKKIATFLALGNKCTRNCAFCDIPFSKHPNPPDPIEPKNIAKAIKELKLQHAVITMVTRDDLIDEGSIHIANIINEVRKTSPNVSLEVLTSDFSGKNDLLDNVLNENPEIFNHNIETVASLSDKIRHKAQYHRSLSVLEHAASANTSIIKSGFMVGFGETMIEVKETIKDLHYAGCEIITIGQYLQASKNKFKVKKFIHPDEFKKYEEYGYSLGIKYMHCGPFVRSSYNARLIKERINKLCKCGQ